MKKKIQIYQYVFALVLEEHSNKVVSANVNMRGRLPADMSEDETKQAGIYKHELFAGKWDWLIAKDRMIALPTHNILVTVVDPIYDGSVKYGGGNITSCLKETCPHCQDTDCDFDCPDAMEHVSDRDMDMQNSKKEDLESNRNYNFACDAIESMVLGHAIAGVNIESLGYIEGLEAAIDAVANKF